VTAVKPPSSEPIDAVYTWDGKSDLRYPLRSLARYAPWIRKVYVVSGERSPKWLARTHSRLTPIKPADLTHNTAAPADLLPWQIFRIPGLSRQFLLLDGEDFLGRPLAAGEFFTAKGGYRFLVEAADIPAGGKAEALLNSRFSNRSPREQVAPTPRLLDRNFLEEVHRLWEKEIKQGGVSLETLYFYFLLENPMQRGAHEKAAMPPDAYDRAPFADSKRVAALLSNGPQFFSLKGKRSLMARLTLLRHYWRRSVFEK
jgi:hypothetical protein